MRAPINHLMRTLAHALSVALILLVQAPAFAAEALPPKVQAALFKKVFLFSSTLKDGSPLVLLAYADEAESVVNDVAAAFSAVGIRTEPVKAAALAGSLSEGRVVYSFPSAAAAVKAASASKKCLTISGFPELSKNGDVTVTVGRKEDGKPEIVIHNRRLKEEGQSFSSDLMSLATVIQ